MKKSQLVSFLLTFLLGPIGLFYSSISGGLLGLLAGIALVATLNVFGALLIWVISMIAGASNVSSYNARIDLEEKRHKELLAAVAQGKGPHA